MIDMKSIKTMYVNIRNRRKQKDENLSNTDKPIIYNCIKIKREDVNLVETNHYAWRSAHRQLRFTEDDINKFTWKPADRRELKRFSMGKSCKLIGRRNGVVVPVYKRDNNLYILTIFK